MKTYILINVIVNILLASLMIGIAYMFHLVLNLDFIKVLIITIGAAVLYKLATGGITFMVGKASWIFFQIRKAIGVLVNKIR